MAKDLSNIPVTKLLERVSNGQKSSELRNALLANHITELVVKPDNTVHVDWTIKYNDKLNVGSPSTAKFAGGLVYDLSFFFEGYGYAEPGSEGQLEIERDGNDGYSTDGNVSFPNLFALPIAELEARLEALNFAVLMLMYQANTVQDRQQLASLLVAETFNENLKGAVQVAKRNPKLKQRANAASEYIFVVVPETTTTNATNFSGNISGSIVNYGSNVNNVSQAVNNPPPFTFPSNGFAVVPPSTPTPPAVISSAGMSILLRRYKQLEQQIKESHDTQGELERCILYASGPLEHRRYELDLQEVKKLRVGLEEDFSKVSQSLGYSR